MRKLKKTEQRASDKEALSRDLHDMWGRPIKVGDIVLACCGQGTLVRRPRFYKIIGVTPKFIRIKGLKRDDTALVGEDNILALPILPEDYESELFKMAIIT